MKTKLWSNEHDTIVKLKEELVGDFGDFEDWDYVHEVNDNNLEELRYDFGFVEVPNEIIVIADLGLWTGRQQAYRMLTNLQAALYSDCDMFEIGFDAYNLVARAGHHDGTNYYTYRMFKDGISDQQKQNFRDLLYNAKATKQHISRYTTSLKPIVKKEMGLVC